MIDINRLRKQEPILFYDENILYEDELADNGTAMLMIRLVSTRSVMRETHVINKITTESDAKLFFSFTKVFSKSR